MNVHDTSNDSLPSAFSLQAPIMNPSGASFTPSSTRRIQPMTDSATDWSEGPPPAVPQPMGLPKTQGKLVPGRMSKPKSNISSTAV